MIVRDLSLILVKNIFVCIDMMFCASLRMTAEWASVWSRMKASGAIVITSAVIVSYVLSSTIMS